MLNVLNKRWLSKGWRVMDEADSEPMALVWIESLDYHKIPFEHYEELYRRSVELRARRMQYGLQCDDFSVDMMIACWPSLAEEIERKRVEERRYLPDTAASDCPRCFGSGVEIVYDADGKNLGGRPGCRHEPLQPGEWLHEKNR